MIPMRPLDDGTRYSYLIHAREDWRSQRYMADLMGMPIRPVCKQFIHNGRKP
jgi:hypothetical protein